MTLVLVFVTIAMVLMVLSVIFAAMWVYRDAKARGLSAGLWTVLVVFSGNFLGLILYLLVGRKQVQGVCAHCGAKISAQSAFCPSCGGRFQVQAVDIKTSKSLLIACIACIVLSIVLMISGMLLTFSISGFSPEFQRSYYSYGTNGFVKNVSQTSNGNEWNLSFQEASEGYTFSKSYKADAKPTYMEADVDCDGSVAIIISQGSKMITETLTSGNYTFDLGDFSEGHIDIKISNVDSANFSGVISITEME